MGLIAVPVLIAMCSQAMANPSSQQVSGTGGSAPALKDEGAGVPAPCSPQPCAANSQGVVVYVTSVTWAAKPSGIFVPDGGLQLVTVHLHFDNGGSKTVPINPLDFKLRDANGVERDFFAYEDSFEAADLAGRGKLDGVLSFPATPSTHTGVLIWSEGLFSGTYHYLTLG